MKQDVRNRVQAMLANLSVEVLAAKSRTIAQRVAGREEFASSPTIMLYLPIVGEVDTLPLARRAWSAGKTLVAPTACDHCRTMRTIFCRPENEEMFHAFHGLRQPDRGLGEICVDQVDLVIVPAVAFDRRCNRLGRGGGFYDRFLARPELHAKTIGVAFAEQIVEHLPVLPEDQPVDRVVTDQETFARTGANE